MEKSKTTSITCLMIIAALLLSFSFASAAGWYDTNWQYRKEIAIDYTKVGDDLTNFSLLVDITDTDLASEALSNGDDILFTSDNGTTKLDHEIELYDDGTGQLVAWVRIPSLSSTANTIVYMYYGNSGASNQENVTAVWDTSYIIVQHLEETSGTHYDSTGNANDCASIAVIDQDATGKIDGADEFDGDNDYLSRSGSLSGTIGTTYTISGWIDPDVVNGRLCELDNTLIFFSPGPSEGVTNYVSLLHRWTGTSGQWLSADNDAITTGEGWIYIAVTYDGSDYLNDAVFYKNGALLNSKEYPGHVPSGTVETNYDDLYIGNRAALDRDFDGKIDEFRISNVIRSSDWIETEYNNQNDPGSFYAVGTEEPLPDSPLISNPDPQNNATEVSVSITELSFYLDEPQNEAMTYSVTTSPDIGSVVDQSAMDHTASPSPAPLLMTQPINGR